MQTLRKGESTKEERVEGVIVAIVIVITLFIAWLAPIVYFNHRLNELRDTKQEIVIKVEYATPKEPSEDMLTISTNY